MKAGSKISIQNTEFTFRYRKTKNVVISEAAVKKILPVLMPLLFAVVAGFLIMQKQLLGFALVAFVTATAVLVLCIISAEAGLYVILLNSFFISFFNRLLFNDSLPAGVFSDALIGATFFGFIIRREPIRNQFQHLLKHRIVLLLLIIYLYTLFEIFNPAGPSISGAIPVIRKIASIILLLFISYRVFADRKSMNRFVKALFFSCLVVALYACVQEWFGFFDFEMNWLRADPRRFRMTFVNGGARRMSFFPDAVSLSIVMAFACVFFTGIALNKSKIYQQVFLFCAVVIMLLAMGYSLTRTSNVMVAAGFFLYLLLTINRKVTKIFAVAAICLFAGLQFLPFAKFNFGDQFVQTLRGGTKDPSFLVREMNRKAIQPYIYRHPFGGGLSTTGDEGLQYHPGHPLAGFPPDGGYLKKALEIGWVGFGLILFLYFTVLKTGIRGYFASKSEDDKHLFAAGTSALFCFYIGDFTQVAIGQITDVVIYYPFIAILLRLKENNLLITKSN